MESLIIHGAIEAKKLHDSRLNVISYWKFGFAVNGKKWHYRYVSTIQFYKSSP